MPLLRYTLLRIALVLGIWAIFRYVFDIDGLLPWILAFVIAFLIAFIAFSRTGDAAAGQLHDLATHRRRPAEPTEDEVHEDALVDEILEDEAAVPEDEPAQPALPEPEPAQPAPPKHGGALPEHEPQAEEQAVGDLEEPGVPQDGDEIRPR